jgi:hypothetical protein
METPQYTQAVDTKFYKDGSVHRFAGNTVICEIDASMPIYTGLLDVQERLKVADSKGKFAFLPPSSFHMTVMEGVCDDIRRPERWSKKLDPKMPLDEVNKFMLECFGRQSLFSPITMRVTAKTTPSWLAVVLDPANIETADYLENFRNQFSTATGIRFPNHDNYTYHISLAYNLVLLTAEEQQTMHDLQLEVFEELKTRCPIFELGQPILTSFDDMFRFDKIS